MDMIELEFDKKIDPEDLDVECLRIPETYMKWAERRVEARSAMDEAELRK